LFFRKIKTEVQLANHAEVFRLKKSTNEFNRKSNLHVIFIINSLTFSISRFQSFFFLMLSSYESLRSFLFDRKQVIAIFIVYFCGYNLLKKNFIVEKKFKPCGD
jgi:hypothetical protein